MVAKQRSPNARSAVVQGSGTALGLCEEFSQLDAIMAASMSLTFPSLLKSPIPQVAPESVTGFEGRDYMGRVFREYFNTTSGAFRTHRGGLTQIETYTPLAEVGNSVF